MKQKVLDVLKKYYKPTMFCIAILGVVFFTSGNTKVIHENTQENKTLTMVRTKQDDAVKAKEQQAIVEANTVFDGLTMDELATKLNKNLNSTLSNKGRLIAEYSTSLGLNPYLVVAIMLHETGCTWECSGLTKQCNNVGGQKGSPSCGGSSYRSYPTIDEGIKGMMDNLYVNFYSKGLTTPEEINRSYAESTTWATKINSYMSKIKAS